MIANGTTPLYIRSADLNEGLVCSYEIEVLDENLNHITKTGLIKKYADGSIGNNEIGYGRTYVPIDYINIEGIEYSKYIFDDYFLSHCAGTDLSAAPEGVIKALYTVIYYENLSEEDPDEPEVDPNAKIINSYRMLSSGDSPVMNSWSYWFIPENTYGTLFEYDATGYMSFDDYDSDTYTTVHCSFDISNLYRQDQEYYMLSGDVTNQKYYRYSPPTFDDCISTAGFMYLGGMGKENVSPIQGLYATILISDDFEYYNL